MSTGTEIAAVIERVIDRKVRRSKAGGPSRVTGKVVSVDPDGTTWVDLGGGVRATPASRTSVELAPGDSVSGTIEHGRLTIDGNLSDVSAGAGSVAEVKGRVSRLADAWKDVVAAAGETSENAKAAEEAAGKAEEAAEEATGKAEQAAADARTAEEKADEILAVTEPIIGEFEQVKELAKENAEKDAQVRDLMESSYARKTQLTEVNAYLKTWVKQSAASYKICAYYSAQGNITQSAKAALDAKKSTLDQAEASLESAIGTLNAANEDAETAYGNLDAAKALLNTAIANLASARALLQQKRDALARLDEDDPGYAQAAAEVEAAAADVAAAKASYDSAFAAVGRMKTALDTATAAVDSASSAVNRAVTQYQTALDGFTEEASACIEVAADAITSTVTGVTNLEATYATCSTAAGTAAKVAALENFRLRTGATVSVWFRYGNTVDENLTLAVNSTGAKAVLFNGGASPGDDVAAWAAGTVCEFVYDGTYWRFVACSNDAKRLATAETTIVQHAEDITLRATKAQLKATYLTCATSGAAQDKVASFVADGDDTAAGKLEAFDLYPGVEISVKFTYKNTHATPRLKIGSSGTAHELRSYSGSALSEAERSWGAGAIVSFAYDGTYWRLLDMGNTAAISVEAGRIDSVVDGLSESSHFTQDSSGFHFSVDQAIAAAGRTASNYVTDVTGGGVMVHPSDDSTTGWKIGSVLELLRSGASYMKAWLDGTAAKVRIGLETASHTVFSPTGMEVFDEDAESAALFGAEVRVGKENGSRVVVAPERVSGTSSENVEYFSFSASSATTSVPVTWRFYGQYFAKLPVGSSTVSDSFTVAAAAFSELTSGSSFRIRLSDENMSTGSVGRAKSLSLTYGTSTSEYVTLDNIGQVLVTYNGTRTFTVRKYNGNTAKYKIYLNEVVYYETKHAPAATIGSRKADSAAGAFSTAAGRELVAGYEGQLAAGKFNLNNGTHAFEIGNGSSDDARSNAFSIDWGGHINASGYNKTLWSGASYYMTAGHTVNLSEPISTQANGIVLQWQAYVNGETQNYDYHYQYVPKSHVQSHEGAGVTTVMANAYFNPIGAKYVYISDNSITGNNENNTSGTSNGITYNNAHWVLTEVYGV